MLSSQISRLAATAGLASGLLFASSAAAIPISLNDFFSFPLTPVTVAADGSSATFGESEEFGLVFLSNIPALGDPEVVIGGAGVTLTFDYAFDEPLGNEDVFRVALLDGATGDAIGGLFDVLFSSTASGSLAFDLSSFVGTTLGLQFELVAGLGDVALTSALTIANLQLLSAPPPPPTTVPEPSSSLLLLVGLTLVVSLSTIRFRFRGTTQT